MGPTLTRTPAEESVDHAVLRQLRWLGVVYRSSSIPNSNELAGLLFDGGVSVDQEITQRPALDLLDGDFYLDPYAEYAWFRENEPVAWDAVNELWGIFRYDDIVEIESHDRDFINSDQIKGGYRPNIPADPAIIGLDNPEHAARRKLVSRRFTPRAISGREDHIRAVVTQLLDAALAKGTGVEVIEELAAPLPARMIGWLLGFPEEDWRKLKAWSEETIVLGGGPRYFDAAGAASAIDFFGEAVKLFEEKKKCPADDVMTIWTQSLIDGRPVTHQEVQADCLLLLDGGAETTRTVIARTLLNLIKAPEQWDGLRGGADISTAVEEFIRFVSPIHNMCRVATRDYEIGGATIKAGQQVVLMYGSANRDPAHFTDPETFDVTRKPNEHIAFGLGTHFCLGAGLARLEIKVFFEEFVRRVAELRLTPGGSVVEMPNAFVFGLRSADLDLVAAD
jgi:cytochrome P450 family 142 subfamily A polypeptide 1